MLKAGLQFNIIFHPLNFKKPELIFEDKVIEVISFPLKHSINCCGFLFREKIKERNIKKEYIQEFNIPIAQIRAIKQGADFETENGKIIPNEQLTTPPPPPVSYAFCSDTAFHPPVVETIKEVSTLYHEATFTEEMKEWAVKTYHSTALDAAKIAKMANAGKLIIGHFSSRYKTTEQFLKEAQSEFKNTETAVDGKKYSIKA